MTVENTDPNCWWVTNHLETLLCHVWSSSTVGTLSYFVKSIIKNHLRDTSDYGEHFPGLDFMLHDFGFRGVSSTESAGIEGAAHLINFKGTDTIVAMEFAMDYYNADPSTLAFSVPATEHSIMTSLGKEGEIDLIKGLIKQFPKGILSVVSDSYDIDNCVDNIYGKVLREDILSRDGKFVVRPDSGDPVTSVLKILKSLYESFGGTVNNKGFKVLNPKVGLLWGDGLDYVKINQIFTDMKSKGWSAENLVCGMGGGLLQQINRDTQRFAFKSSYQERKGKGYDIYKSPKDGSKASKRGRLKLCHDHTGYFTVPESWPTKDLLETVFEDGALIRDMSFEEVRKKSLIKE